MVCFRFSFFVFVLFRSFVRTAFEASVWREGADPEMIDQFTKLRCFKRTVRIVTPHTHTHTQTQAHPPLCASGDALAAEVPTRQAGEPQHPLPEPGQEREEEAGDGCQREQERGLQQQQQQHRHEAEHEADEQEGRGNSSGSVLWRGSVPPLLLLRREKNEEQCLDHSQTSEPTLIRPHVESYVGYSCMVPLPFVI